MVEPVSGDAGAVWIKQEARYAAIMAGEDPDELDKEEEPPAPPAAPAAAAATPAAAAPAAVAPAAAGGGGSGGGGGAEVVSYYIAKNNCRVRDAPEQSADVIGDVDRGMVVKSLQVQGDWIRIVFHDEKVSQTHY